MNQVAAKHRDIDIANENARSGLHLVSEIDDVGEGEGCAPETLRGLKIVVCLVDQFQSTFNDNFAVSIHRLKLGEYHADFREALEACHLSFQLPGLPKIVGIEKGHIVAASLANSLIASAGYAGILLVDIPDSRVVSVFCRDHRSGIVFRAVVDNYDFPIPVGLCTNAVNCPAYAVGTIVGRHNYTNQARFHPALPYSIRLTLSSPVYLTIFHPDPCTKPCANSTKMQQRIRLAANPLSEATCIRELM